MKRANAQYSVGYDPFDDYDIGSKDQRGFVSSRYGTREQLERCVAMLRANGLNVIVDLVENHDTDHDNNNHIVQGKMLAYAYILTSEGLPEVFYRDYSMDAGSYHLKPLLDKLILIHETLASGTTQQRWKDGDIFAYERLGGPHLLTPSTIVRTIRAPSP